MGITQIISLILGVLQFPKEIGELLKILKKTPQQNHEGLLQRIQLEAKNYEDTGRPKWD
jgi:hypothetical protein